MFLLRFVHIATLRIQGIILFLSPEEEFVTTDCVMHASAEYIVCSCCIKWVMEFKMAKTETHILAYICPVKGSKLWFELENLSCWETETHKKHKISYISMHT